MGHNREAHHSTSGGYDPAKPMRQAKVRVVLLADRSVLYDLNTGKRAAITTLPLWMDESIAMLNMVELGDEVPGIGCKVDVASAGPTYYLTIRGELPYED